MRRTLCPLIAALALAVAGCGGDGEATTTDQVAIPPATTEQASPPTNTKADGAPAERPKLSSPARPSPDGADSVPDGRTLGQVIQRLGEPRDYKPRDDIDCMYWTTTEPSQEIEVCFTNTSVSRSKSARTVPAG